MQAPFDAVAEIYDDTRGPPADALRQLVKVLAAELQGCKRAQNLSASAGQMTSYTANDMKSAVGGTCSFSSFLESNACLPS